MRVMRVIKVIAVILSTAFLAEIVSAGKRMHNYDYAKPAKTYVGLLQAVDSDDVQVLLKFLAQYKQARLDVDKERNDLGQTALMVAAKNGNVDMVKVLLTYGANLWLRDNNHKTAIALAKMSNVNQAKKSKVVAILERAAQPEAYKAVENVGVEVERHQEASVEYDDNVLEKVLDQIAKEE